MVKLSELRTRADVAELLETTDEQLRYLLYARLSIYRYRKFKIPKKSGGTRLIESPQTDLKLLQQKLVSVLNSIHRSQVPAHGFAKNRSVATNARQHVGKRFVFNVDLENFFPSINFGRVRGVFLSDPFGLSPNAATVIAQICCHNGALPQGAPTSPIISNIICFRLDRTLLELARKYKCKYTRYADDLTFSKKSGLFPSEIGYIDEKGTAHVGKELYEQIEANGFKVNKRKVRLQNNQNRQSVTGLTVNSKCNVSRKYIRQIRAMIYAWRKHGLSSAEAEHSAKYYRRTGKRGKIPKFKRIIRGKLAFVKMVKGPSDPAYKNLQKQLLKLDKGYYKVMLKENSQMNKRDFFISHASEDKDTIVRPLVKELVKAGYTVWYDEYEIKVGDSLRGKIDEGLSNSRFGIVVLSKSFFGKKWPKRELDGLTAIEDSEGKKKILPIWHELDHTEVTKYSPSLAGLKALITGKQSVKTIAKLLGEVL